MTTKIVRFGLAMCVAMVAAGAWAQNAPTTPPATPPAPTPPSANEKPKTEYVQLTIGGAVKGDIVLELNREKAPITVENFLSYVDKKFYDGTIFHRIMNTFMIQGGGMTPDMKQKPTDPPIKNEWRNGLKNLRGTIAMARMGGNPDSATSQFFINVVDNPMLDQPQRDGAAYAVFGKVVAGMNVVDKIRDVPTTYRGQEKSVPTETVTVERAVRISAEEARKKIDAEAKPTAPTTPRQPAPSQPSKSQ